VDGVVLGGGWGGRGADLDSVHLAYEVTAADDEHALAALASHNDSISGLIVLSLRIVHNRWQNVRRHIFENFTLVQGLDSSG
jgi:hypothetical protein